MPPGSRPAPAAHDLRLLILLFTAGVLAMHALAELPSPAWLAALSAPALLPWRGRVPWAAATLGVLLVAWHAQAYLAERWPERRQGEDVEVRGTVASLPEAGGDVTRFLFEPDRGDLPRRVRVSWYRPPETVRGGECREFTLRMRVPHGSLNPGGFDYEGWLYSQGVGATATVREGARCDAPAARGVLALRQVLVEALHERLPAHPAAPLVAALSVGDRSGFTDADWDVFRRTGTSHLVAISGLHVGIVAAAAFFLVRWLWAAWPPLCLRLPAQRAGLLGALVAAAAYAVLSGFQPPVQRALVMLAVVAAAAWFHRLAVPSRVLAVAWAAVLLLEPAAVLSPGLWLSFGAVAAILYVSVGRLRPPGFWHSALFLQLMLAVALAPLTLLFFQGAAWIAPLANLVAVPLFVMVTPLVLGSVMLSLAWPALGMPALSGMADVLELFRAGLGWTASVPELWLPAGPPALLLGVAACGIVLLFSPRGLPLKPLGALCLVPLLLVPDRAPAKGFDLAVLDVGQGLAVVVRTATRTLVYDTGPAFDEGFDAGESVVVPYLLAGGVRRVDRLVLSHEHNDHVGGAAAVRGMLRAGDELTTGDGGACRDGARWEWDGVTFEVLHPDGGTWPVNNRSCVVRIEGDGWSVLLPGDIEKAAERRLVAVHGDRLRADVLVAPHHGSRTSSTPEFVDAVRPAFVIHGAGWRNHFRHPRPEVVTRYDESGARQFVTGNSGAILVSRNADRLEVREWRREARRFWNAPAVPGGDRGDVSR